MRLILLLWVFILAGCAGQSKVSPPVQERITPINVQVPMKRSFQPLSEYLIPLMVNTAQEPYYQLINPKALLNQYRFSHQIMAPDKRKTVFAFKQKQGLKWGYVTTGIGRQPVANVFDYQSAQGHRFYALVLQQVKVCFVSNAEGLPRWQAKRWLFPQSPGYFECTGMTNKNIFKLGTGLPALLGDYYDERDTVFVSRSFGQLQQIIWALKQQFPKLKIPEIMGN